MNIPFWLWHSSKIFHSLQGVERLCFEVGEEDLIYFEVYLPVVANHHSKSGILVAQ